MTGVSSLGLWPGLDPLDAQLKHLEDLEQVPYGVQGFPAFVQCPDRGPGANALGRTLALLSELPTEIGPHGWKLASHRGIDLQRAQSFLEHDLEALSIAGSGYTGNLAIQLVGPWTLAASVYLSKADRILTDLGAVRELAQGLTDATANHIAQIKQRVPGAQVTVQFDETLLGQIGVGALPTFSGYSRIRAVPGPTLVEVLKPLIEKTQSFADTTMHETQTVIHIGQAWSGIAPVVLSGADSLGMEFTHGASWNERGWELIARAMEKGLTLWAGLPAPLVSQCSGTNLQELADLVTVGWGRMGLPHQDLDEIVVTQSKPAAKKAYDGGEQGVRAQHSALIRVAEHLAERAAQ